VSTAIVWFRRDLRLADQPALTQALAAADTVIPVHVHSPGEEGAWAPGGASRWWLHHSLAALDTELRVRGSRLVLREGPALAALEALIAETGATAVYWNRLYEPALIERDKSVKQALAAVGIEAVSCSGHLLFEPWTVKNGAGEPYRVFTPFWKACVAQLGTLPAPLPAPDRLPAVPATLSSRPLAALQLLPKLRWDGGLAEAWLPGEAGAMARLARFVDEAIEAYDADRNRPDLPGSSRLSPYLHFGELSPRQALAAARAPGLGDSAGAVSFIRELGWREFAHHLLFHFPHTTDAPLDARFEGLAWREEPADLEAWRRGRTGYPIVDAGMRELWTTGWMHNRVRMIVASLLTKNLFTHWRHGAHWFWDTLVDADLANNTLGWQWAAGCGADAAPYYRIFNPVLQAEKFDPARAYIRRWVPEIAALPDKYVHCPWQAPAEVLLAAGVRLGQDYPLPVVDPRSSRDEALRRFEGLKRPGR
jgi:deoxyribodipyrimidine photo-lyase